MRKPVLILVLLSFLSVQFASVAVVAEEFPEAYSTLSEEDRALPSERDEDEITYEPTIRVNENDEEISDYVMGWVLFPLALPALIYLNFIGWWEDTGS